MFLDTQIFKKMIKNAYDGGGLSVAREKDKYILAGGFWCIKIRKDCLPPKAKAAVIEIVGEFPEDGENFIIRKREDKRPDEFAEKWKTMIVQFGNIEGKPLYTKTNILHEYNFHIYRFWQSDKKRIVMLNEIFTGLIGSGNIIRDRETDPEGPYMVHEWGLYSGLMYWKNNAGELFAATADEPKNDSVEELMAHLLCTISLPGYVR